MKKVKGRCSRVGLQTILLDDVDKVVKCIKPNPTSAEISKGLFLSLVCFSVAKVKNDPLCSQNVLEVVSHLQKTLQQRVQLLRENHWF